jgi:hypothetical protein
VSDSAALKSYLVALGFDVDQNELRKFDVALKQATGFAESHTTGIIKQFLKWEGAIVGGFAAISGAVLGYADKLAQADLDQQIFANRMFLSQDAAKKLTIATKALGYSLEDIAWNPELQSRFEKLWDDQERMQKALGPDYERTMLHIRDARFEITRIEVALQYLGSAVIEKVMTALGGQDWVEKLGHWADFLSEHLPEISDTVSRYLVPLLRDAEHVGDDVLEVLKALGTAFVQIVGAINGDDGLKDGKLTIDSFGQAIDEVADDAVKFTDAMTSALKVTIDLFKAMVQLVTFHWGDALSSMGEAAGAATPGGVGLIGTGILGAVLGTASVGALVKLGLKAGGSFLRGVLEGASGELGGAAAAEGGAAAAAGGAEAAGGGAALAGAGLATGGVVLAGAAIGSGVSWWDKHYGPAFRRKLGLGEDPRENRRRLWQAITGQPVDALDSAYTANRGTLLESGNAGGDVQDIIASIARAHGVDPALAAAVAQQESGTRMRDSSGRLIESGAHAQGMFQLLPSTAAGLGVDAGDLRGNITGGVELLQHLLQKYGTTDEALAGYNWGEGRLDRLEKRKGGFSFNDLPAETQNYIRSIEGSMQARGETVVHVHVAGTNATPQQIADATKRGIDQADRRNQRASLAVAQGVYN